tara:strand:- start:217 stop:447 length:231 start_codon:yes stop_codon:yes gene_type:complete
MIIAAKDGKTNNPEPSIAESEMITTPVKPMVRERVLLIRSGTLLSKDSTWALIETDFRRLVARYLTPNSDIKLSNM